MNALLAHGAHSIADGIYIGGGMVVAVLISAALLFRGRSS